MIFRFLLFALYLSNTFSSAQAQASVAGSLAPIELHSPQQFLAQNLIPTDETPFQVLRPREAAGSDFRFRLFKKLPAPFWFNAITEETLRWETNVYQNPTHGVQDMVFRSLPNITAGWALGERTNIYSNYFVIKDIYAVHGNLTFPTTQSLSMGIRRDFPLSEKTVLQLDMQARELWEVVHVHQADLLPAINLTRVISPHTIFFGSLLLQMRSRELFQGPTRELDPFYNVGITMSYHDWNFVITDTYVTNFRNHTAIPPEGNVSMIADFEVAHPVSKRIAGLYTFIRAEPIWNWRSHFISGQSGYDFRLYGGFRFVISKPAYNADIAHLRAKLKNQVLNMEEWKKTHPNGSSNSDDSSNSSNSSSSPNTPNSALPINFTTPTGPTIRGIPSIPASPSPKTTPQSSAPTSPITQPSSNSANPQPTSSGSSNSNKDQNIQ